MDRKNRTRTHTRILPNTTPNIHTTRTRRIHRKNKNTQPMVLHRLPTLQRLRLAPTMPRRTHPTATKTRIRRRMATPAQPHRVRPPHLQRTRSTLRHITYIPHTTTHTHTNSTKNMRTKIILFALFAALTASLLVTIRQYRKLKTDRDRLRQNQSILLHNGATTISNTPDNHSQASTPAVNLQTAEFQQSGSHLLHTARQAHIKATRITSAATANTTTQLTIHTQLQPSHTDTTLQHTDETHTITWKDPWVSLTGTITNNQHLQATITANDTLDIIVHRVPRRFLFFRFGCREVRMNIISRNPHTRLTYARFYQLRK